MPQFIHRYRSFLNVSTNIVLRITMETVYNLHGLQWCHKMAWNGNINIGSVFEEYLQKEQQFEQEIEKRNKLRREIYKRNISKVSNSLPTKLPLNLEKSRIRNQVLLKDLEMSRARLRTYASYTPTDAELQQISSVYRNHLCRNIQDTES